MSDSTPQPLVSVFEHDPEMADIVALFVAEMPERIADLRHAIESGDLDRAITFAHQLKGAAGGYGFEALGGIAAGAEHALIALREAGDAPSTHALQAATQSMLDACGRVRLSEPKTAA